MSDVDAPWSDVYEIGEMTDTDFQKRTSEIKWYVSEESDRGIVTALASEWGLNDGAAADRIIRYYLTFLESEYDELDSLAEDHDVRALTPPLSVVERYPNVGDGGSLEPVYVSTPPAIIEMIDAAIESDVVDADSRTDFVTEAVRWIAGA